MKYTILKVPKGMSTDSPEYKKIEKECLANLLEQCSRATQLDLNLGVLPVHDGKERLIGEIQ